MRARGIIISLIFLLPLLLGLYPFLSSAQTVAEVSAQIEGMLARIAELKAVLENLSASSAGSGTTPIPSSPCVSLTRTLSFGSRGEDVRELQRFLIEASFLGSAYDTGYFGSLTEAAVKKWQAANGIVSSGDAASTGFGVVGPKTRASIVARCSSAQSAAVTSQQKCPMPPPIPQPSECTGMWEVGFDAGGCLTGYQCILPAEPPQSAEPPPALTTPEPVIPPPPSITISAPVSGTTVMGGSALSVAWRSSDAPQGARVALSLTREGGGTLGVIADSLASSGTYRWSVPSERTDCRPGESAFDCISKIAQCEGNTSICNLSRGIYRIVATLSSGASATSPPFQVGGTALSGLLEALTSTSLAPPPTSLDFSPAPADTSATSEDMCVHEGQQFTSGVTLSVPCQGGSCPSSSSGTGFITGTCTRGQWCIPYTTNCASSLVAIDTSSYAGGGAGGISSGYSVNCPQEGWTAYLSCPYGGCQTGWNTCRGGHWVRESSQQVVQVGQQGPCGSGQVWCEIGTEHGFGCVPSFQCVNGMATP
ncbi:hypothetical protein A3A39_00430 [Candidatus Kaiserbacteria bacterium RIFCSPLOWO2_01_FULL_54_13]|uniref:Peptidoglycan binding-like domain-containing protein n=1 Tax=Candidatus Kaiserbacteria bacterium RIFCSPLOWO2_01_FULL_54_13 TaxID=1798512 RepID=A0A1F6F0M2_9BACT|nr:MAG: hypothetical protein A3A39_00430 [Candidatus Kaiserbacteria bacterium RIFCSPLOWO2_01_FULL_54_13]